MKEVWIITEEDHGVLGVAENPDDAIYWLHKHGWLNWDDVDAVSWYDGAWHELSIREAAERHKMSIEDFLEVALIEGIDNCELRFFLRCVPMIESYNQLSE